MRNSQKRKSQLTTITAITISLHTETLEFQHPIYKNWPMKGANSVKLKISSSDGKVWDRTDTVFAVVKIK